MTNKISGEYEKNVAKSYSEFSDFSPGKWASGTYKGKWTDYYKSLNVVTDLFVKPIRAAITKSKINLVDFGGGDGILLHNIIEQMRDVKINAINLDSTDKNLKMCREKYPEIDAQKWDIREIYKPNFADAVISRYVIHYLGLDEQVLLAKNMYFCLKNGGVAIFLWPSSIDFPEEFNEYAAKIAEVITGEDEKNIRKSRRYSSQREFCDILRKAGFESVEPIDSGVKQFNTAEGWIERFNLNAVKSEQIRSIFLELSVKYPRLFNKRHGFISCWSDHLYVVAKKKLS